MEEKLIEKLQLIAEKYGKIDDLHTYVGNGKDMYLDESKEELIFNHVFDADKAKTIAAEIIEAMREFGYSARVVDEKQLTDIMREYTIKYYKP